MEDPTRKGVELIQRWRYAIERLDDCGRAKISAECELTNATNALGHWMSPSDMRVGETISVWYGSELIAVTKTEGSGNGTFKIEIRKGAHHGKK